MGGGVEREGLRGVDDFGVGEAAPFPCEGGEEEEIEGSAGEEAAEDDDGHGAFDFATSLTAPEGEGEDAEGGDEGGHEDGHEAFGGALGGRLERPLEAFLGDEVIIVGDEHDRISGTDSEEGDEADPGADGSGATAEEDGEDAADEGEREVGEDEGDMIEAPEDEAEEGDDSREGEGEVEEQFAGGFLFFFGGAAPFEVEAMGEENFFFDALASLFDKGSDGTAFDIAGDGLASSGAVVLDIGAAIGELEIGEFAEGQVEAVGVGEEEIADGFGILAGSFIEDYREVTGLVFADDLSD